MNQHPDSKTEEWVKRWSRTEGLDPKILKSFIPYARSAMAVHHATDDIFDFIQHILKIGKDLTPADKIRYHSAYAELLSHAMESRRKYEEDLEKQWREFEEKLLVEDKQFDDISI